MISNRLIKTSLILIFVFGYLALLLWFDGSKSSHVTGYFLWDKFVLFLCFLALANIYGAYRRYFLLATYIAAARVMYDVILIVFGWKLNTDIHIKILFLIVILFLINLLLFKRKIKWLQLKR